MKGVVIAARDSDARLELAMAERLGSGAVTRSEAGGDADEGPGSTGDTAMDTECVGEPWDVGGRDDDVGLCIAANWSGRLLLIEDSP